MTHGAFPVPEAAFAQHAIVLGKTGSGKSSVLRVVAEHKLRRQQPVCVIDPKGDWWGLKSSADGKSPGFPVVIFGGEHADIPINSMAGAQIAELYATGNRPCIVDLGGWTVADRTRFFIDFSQALFKLTRGPRWLIIDEVHNFAPQGKIHDPQAGRMLHWANRIITEGRGKGITVLSASQRPQKVHKDFVTSNETLIAMRVIHPLDRNAIKEWIDGSPDRDKGKEVLESLASMKRGEGWVWSPEIGFGPKHIAFPLFETFDSFAAPKNEADRHPKGWADVDLEEVKTKLADVVKDAEANDPKLLQARIRELERQVAQKVPEVDPRAMAEAEQRGYERGRQDGYHDGRADVIAAISHVSHRLAELVDDVKQKREAHYANAQTAPHFRSAASNQVEKPEVRARAPRPAASGSGDPSLGNTGKRRILIALAQNPEGLTGTKLSLLTGISQGGGTWRTYMGELRGAGWIEGDRSRLLITDAGLRALGEYEPLPEGTALLDYWRNRLGDTGMRRVFDTLVDAYPRALPQAEVARRSSIELGGGTWRTYVGKLRGLELVTGRGELKASEDLFG